MGPIMKSPTLNTIPNFLLFPLTSVNNFFPGNFCNNLNFDFYLKLDGIEFMRMDFWWRFWFLWLFRGFWSFGRFRDFRRFNFFRALGFLWSLETHIFLGF